MESLTKTKINALFLNDILEIEFKMIKQKLQDKEEGQNWSQVQCNEAETEYKKFLALKRTYPEKDIVPHKIVDIFWHQHILDTQKYAEDCENIFGYFLHHYPYFGMTDEVDKQQLVDAFEETKMLYKKHFGEYYGGEAHKCKAHKCRTACKPMKCR